MLKQLRPYINLNNGVLLVAFLITASWVWGTVEAIQRNFVLQQKVDTLAQEIAFYELESDTLKFQQKYYQTDEYLELSARERLNKAAPDEKLLMLPPNTISADIDDAEPAVIPVAQRSNLQQWLYFLFAAKE